MTMQNNDDRSNHHNWHDQSQKDNPNRGFERFILPGDAIYDFERVPPVWSGFDEQSNEYLHDKIAEGQPRELDCGESADVIKLEYDRSAN